MFYVPHFQSYILIRPWESLTKQRRRRSGGNFTRISGHASNFLCSFSWPLVLKLSVQDPYCTWNKLENKLLTHNLCKSYKQWLKWSYVQVRVRGFGTPAATLSVVQGQPTAGRTEQKLPLCTSTRLLSRPLRFTTAPDVSRLLFADKCVRWWA